MRKSKHPPRAAAPGQHTITSESWEFWLFSRTMAVNSHRGSSGRNCSDPFTRLRNTRVAFHHVTHCLCGVDGGLWPRAHDYVLARIRSKCRCAKHEWRRRPRIEPTSRPSDLVCLLFSRPNCDAASNFVQAYLPTFELPETQLAFRPRKMKRFLSRWRFVT